MADEISSFSPRSIDTQMGPIDWTRPRLPRQPLPWPVGGASVSPQPGFWQNLQNFAAPAARVAGEMTGVPAAARAGQAFAEGNAMQGAGQALMALPGRLTALPGMILSEAGAAEPDPRMKAISDLNREIAQREKKLGGFPRINFPSRAARADAVRIEESGIAAARARIKTLEGELDQERRDAASRTQAEASTARWARTPFQQRYPGVLEGAVGGMAAAGGLVPFFATRGRVRHHVGQVQALDDQIAAAVARANNTTLRQGQTHAALARERTAAAHEARQLQAQREALVAEGTPGHGVWGHLGAAAGGGALTELPMAGALAHDYLAGRADPSGELYNKTLEAVNVVDNPGQVAGRYAIPFGLGFAAGGAGHYLGGQGGNVPAGHAGAVTALKQQYRAPRKR